MQFPPVSRLATATFEFLDGRKPSQGAIAASPRAPQPVSKDEPTNAQSDGPGLNAPGTSGTNQVGQVLNALA